MKVETSVEVMRVAESESGIVTHYSHQKDINRDVRLVVRSTQTSPEFVELDVEGIIVHVNRRKLQQALNNVVGTCTWNRV